MSVLVIVTYYNFIFINKYNMYMPFLLPDALVEHQEERGGVGFDITADR